MRIMVMIVLFGKSDLNGFGFFETEGLGVSFLWLEHYELWSMLGMVLSLLN